MTAAFSALNDPTAAAIRAEIDANSTQLAAIVGDTNELQGDWANGGRLDLLVDAIKAVTDALPNGGALTDLATQASVNIIDGIVDAILVDTGTDIPALLATIDGIVDAIKAKTDSLTFTVAGEVDANARSMNDVTITGAGTEADPWT
jgi:hypothetical protein